MCVFFLKIYILEASWWERALSKFNFYMSSLSTSIKSTLCMNIYNRFCVRGRTNSLVWSGTFFILFYSLLLRSINRVSAPSAKLTLSPLVWIECADCCYTFFFVETLLLAYNQTSANCCIVHLLQVINDIISFRFVEYWKFCADAYHFLRFKLKKCLGTSIQLET